jgi:Cof subfamily protein (haloacid dehalogenase superfamily)
VIRLVATDLDGTALRTYPADPYLSDRLVAAVDAVKRAGVAIVVVTGRTRRSAATIAREIGADRLICSNGALVWDLDHDVVDRHWSFDPEVAHAIAGRLRDRAPDVAFSWESHEEFGWDEAFEVRWGGPRKDWHRVTAGPVEELCTTPIVKLIASLHGDRAEQQRLFHELLAELPDIVGAEAALTTAGGGWVEIGPPGITKAVTLAEIAAELGIEAAEVIAFGDAMNDVPMLEWAGRGVAMGNADDEVKAIADEVTLSNDDDGVAVVLESVLHERDGAGVEPAPGP